jgi:hypothetical protein
LEYYCAFYRNSDTLDPNTWCKLHIGFAGADYYNTYPINTKVVFDISSNVAVDDVITIGIAVKNPKARLESYDFKIYTRSYNTAATKK